jgi:hypothetical protein
MESLLKAYLPGAVASVASLSIGYPFCTIKTRLQSGKFDKLFDCIKQRTLYRGIAAPLTTALIVRPMEFAIFEKTRSQIGNLNAGIVAGLAAGVIGSPIHFTKVNIQTHGHPIGQFIRNTYQTQGLSGFYKGYPLNILTSGVYGGIYLGVYGKLRDIMTDSHLVYFSIGGLSSLITVALVFPLDIARTRVLTSQDRLGMIECWRSILEKRGILGLWRGILPVCVKTFPSSAVGMMTYEFVRKKISEN